MATSKVQLEDYIHQRVDISTWSRITSILMLLLSMVLKIIIELIYIMSLLFMTIPMLISKRLFIRYTLIYTRDSRTKKKIIDADSKEQ